MGNILSFILSMSLIFASFLLGSDLLNMQIIFAELDSVSSTISYRIAKNAGLSTNLESELETKYKVNLRLEDPNKSYYEKGESIGYFIEKDYKPLFLLKENIKISVRRFAIVSQFN